MSSEFVICPECGHENDYSVANCRCGRFIGFPNRRDAAEQQAELETRYSKAISSACSRGVDALIDELALLVTNATPVICMSIEAADDITRGAKYKNYHSRVDRGERNLAAKINESARTLAEAKLYPGFFMKIHYAALSTNGRGLVNYGDLALSWKVTEQYLERRISVHEENSFDFYNRHSLGDQNTPPPKGYAGVWGDRKKVVTAKLEARLTPGTSTTSIAGMVLGNGTGRETDDFVEVAVYEDKGIDALDLQSVTVQNPPTNGVNQQRLELVEATCATRGIAFFT
ncbi:hypothetical protein [uncultured Pelagimonas sp.]|uniref:hypothetical protein n=1 Tax=uncultured Pelagimonas sp. TaxID=1618102 RepID=UPI0026100744|nr:hypothetical protein [uncultured Pelagimonas sp.]